METRMRFLSTPTLSTFLRSTFLRRLVRRDVCSMPLWTFASSYDGYDSCSPRFIVVVITGPVTGKIVLTGISLVSRMKGTPSSFATTARFFPQEQQLYFSGQHKPIEFWRPSQARISLYQYTDSMYIINSGYKSKWRLMTRWHWTCLEVWATGRNDFGQLGDGTVTHRMTPVEASLACC